MPEARRPATPAAVGRVPPVLRDRVEARDRLRAAVEPGAGNGVYVLHGLGGCGKTAVAYALFQYATGQAGLFGTGAWTAFVSGVKDGDL